MKRIGLLITLAVAVGVAAGPVLAGPVDSVIPPNPCGIKPLKLVWVADGIGTDTGGTACDGVGSGCVETMIVCKHAGGTGSNPMDIAVELFDSSGASVGPLGCDPGVAPGGGASFVTTGILPSPYTGTVTMTAGPIVPLGALRVLSTIPGKTVCDVTLVDTEGPGSGTTAAAPFWSNGVTLTKKKTAQKGD